MKIIALLLLAAIIGCDSSSGGDQEVVAEVMEPEVLRTTEFFSVGGNLWKPRSDETSAGGGRLVVLFDAKFSRQFDNCEVQTSAGETSQMLCINTEEWTMIPFSCFSNGNRQTWRASIDCEEAAEVRVICRLPGEEYEFLAPNGRTAEVCSRFG